MNRFLIFFFLIVPLFSITECCKYGCTDKTALNYDPKAKFDDGSCEYLVIKFAGNYTATDTGFDIVSDSNHLVINNVTFHIADVGTGHLWFTQFFYNISYLPVYAYQLNFIDSSDYRAPLRLYGYLNLSGNNLYYNMGIIQDGVYINRHWGSAIK